MPPGGHPARARRWPPSAGSRYERFVDAEIGILLERLQPLEESLEYDSDDASLIRVTRRDWEKQRRVPTELRTEMIRSAALGNQVWIEARATNDFAKFLPALERNLDLKRRYVECFEWDDSPYTPLLDDFEPLMQTSEVSEVFATIRPVLSELVKEARTSTRPSSRRLSRRRAEGVLRAHAFDHRPRGGVVPARSDRASVLHVLLAPRRPYDDALRERPRRSLVDDARGGHAQYAHGIAASLERTPLAGSPSLGLNESQSRTWENLVGRSRPFWLHWFEPLRETFPGPARGSSTSRRSSPPSPCRAGAHPRRGRRDDVQPSTSSSASSSSSS
jgi:carboxypeptidase Taq